MPPPRSALHPGVCVLIVQKHDQSTGTLTQGTIHRLLTSGENHPHGIKVELITGQVGRVQSLVEEGRPCPTPNNGGVSRVGRQDCDISAHYDVARVNPSLHVDEPVVVEVSSADCMVTEMGFQRDHAVEALRRCNGVLGDAVEFVLEHGEAGMALFVAEWDENKYDVDFPSMS